MKLALREDLNKIKYSKQVKWVIIFSLLFIIVGVSLKYIFEGVANNNTLLGMIFTDKFYLLTIPFFAVLICSKDYSSPTLDNLYRKPKKIEYVISKIIFVLSFILVCFLFSVVVNTLFNAIFSDGIVYWKKQFDTDKNVWIGRDDFTITQFFNSVGVNLSIAIILGLLSLIAVYFFNLKEVKHDGYKIIKSLAMKFVVVFIVLYAFLIPVMSYFIHDGGNQTVVDLLLRADYVLPAIFYSIVLCSKDLGGYFKNIGSKTNKFNYVLSKVIWLFIGFIFVTIVNFLVALIFNLLFGNSIVYSFILDRFTISQFFMALGGAAFGFIMVGTFGMLLTFLIKNGGIAVAIFVTYHFLSSTIWGLVDPIFGLYPGTLYQYSLTAFATNLLSTWFYPDKIMFYYGIAIARTALFFILSYLLIRRKRV